MEGMYCLKKLLWVNVDRFLAVMSVCCIYLSSCIGRIYRLRDEKFKK